MSSGELHDLGTVATVPTGPCDTIWGRFAEQVLARGPAVAVVDGETDVDYRRLAARAESVCGALVASGIAPGSLVGVCLERGWDLVATLLGVARAGCGYVPMDPAYPSERLRYVVEHSGAAAVVVDATTAGLCPQGPEVVRLDRVADGSSAPAHPPAGTPDDIAYVIYTSGSTGEPKGVAVEHRNVVAMAEAMGALLDEDELSGVLASTSVCFDPSVMEILATLMLGGAVVLADDALAVRGSAVAHRVRTTVSVPSAMKALLRSGGVPAHVRCVVLGGEVLTRSLADALHALPSAPRVVNVYGPTEATVFTTVSEVETGDRPISIGRTVPGTRAYVLDDSLQPVRAGAVGELFLAGEQVARGYLHDDERTAQQFPLVGPDVPVPERRLYRTGDLCRWDDAGELVFVGRADRQVKVRGYRIELDEVETAVASLPEVGDAAVTLESAGDRNLLVAYVSPADGAADPAVIRSRLADKVPRHLVPHVVVPVEDMPRLPNGKVDRRRLPDLRQDRPPAELGASSGPSVPVRVARPSSPWEVPVDRRRSALLDVLRQEVATIAGSTDPASVRTDTTLELMGLDSLDVVELTERLSEVLATQVTCAEVAEQATPDEVADALLARHLRPSVPDPQAPAGDGGAAARLDAFQAQVRTGHPPAFAAKVAAWSASDRAALVHHLRALVSRAGLDPYGKVIRTGSAERGVVADVHTGEEYESLIWTTNLYLGMNRAEGVVESARDALDRFGTGMGISAAGSGQTDLHRDFEREFAAAVGKPAACLFPTGFTASLGAVAGLVGDQDVVVMDQLCHASLVDGARLSGAKVRTFRHDDVDDLRRVLHAVASPYRTTLVVLESVYSMGEGRTPLRDVVRAAKEAGALVLVDEAHSFGLYGESGAGLCAADGVTEDVDVVLTTLSKALGSIGGVVAADERLVELLRSSARSYVFQANVSPADVGAALAALRRVRGSDALRARLWDTAHYLRERLVAAGYDLGSGDGLIVTPFVADGERLRALARSLFRRGVHVAAVSYPIVEKGQGRLRFICSASHTRADVDRTVEALAGAEAEVAAEAARRVSRGRADASRVPAAALLREWGDGFVESVQQTLAGSSTVPRLTIELAAPDEQDVVLVVDEGPVVRRAADGLEDAQGCRLELRDHDAVTALCSGDVEALLAAVVEGRCVLSGRTQPFVWLVGRLSDRRRSEGIGADRPGERERTSVVASH